MTPESRRAAERYMTPALRQKLMLSHGHVTRAIGATVTRPVLRELALLQQRSEKRTADEGAAHAWRLEVSARLRPTISLWALASLASYALTSMLGSLATAVAQLE